MGLLGNWYRGGPASQELGTASLLCNRVLRHSPKGCLCLQINHLQQLTHRAMGGSPKRARADVWDNTRHQQGLPCELT